MKKLIRSKHRRLSQFLYSLSLVFLGLGLFSLGWAVWPAPTDAVMFNIPDGLLPGAPAGEAFASLSAYTLEISWPAWVRKGERGVLSLRLTDQDPLPAGLADESQVVLAEPVLYPLHVDPPGGVQASLGDDQTLELTWAVSGETAGDYAGKLYVSFGFFDDAEDALISVPVTVVDLQVRVIELWGLASGLVIWLGFVSLVLWGALFVSGRVVSS
ncbi:MAG: hypothetical protein ACNA70_02165 [Brevefilum sp.]